MVFIQVFFQEISHRDEDFCRSKKKKPYLSQQPQKFCEVNTSYNSMETPGAGES